MQTGSTRLPRGFPAVRSGTLILDDQVDPSCIPGGLLSCIADPVHYLDLNGVPVASLAELGGTPAFWAGVSKIYASHGTLTSLDGLQYLTAVRYLYLDGNRLPESQLFLLTELPPGQLECLDIQGNPGFTEEVMHRLLESGLLSRAEFVNGQRLRDGR